MRRGWLISFIIISAVAARDSMPAPQEPFALPGQAAATTITYEIAPDTISQPAAVPTPDSSKRFHFRIDAGYHAPPVHPYFRNEYRIIEDMRRLVHFVDREKIHGYESVPDLFALARKLPEGKQTEILRAAVAGSVANFASEMASKKLREKKIRFVQWELEKVVFRGAFRLVNLNLFNGVTERGFGVQIPRLRLTFARQSSAYYITESLTCWPLRYFGVSYTRLDGRPIITPIIASPFGTAAFSYDRDFEILASGFEFRRKSSIIIRMVRVTHLRLRKADYMRSEVMLRW